MVVIKFNGGIGNQLFQWAFCEWCRSLGVEVMVDVSEYQKHKIHGGFLLPDIAPSFWEKFATVSSEQCKSMCPDSLFNRIENRLFKHKGLHYYEGYFQNRSVEEFLLSCKKDVYLEGWWQNADIVYRVLQDMKREIQKFCVHQNREELLNIAKNSVSVHVRRGDYVNNTAATKLYGGICTEDYYSAAIRYFSKKYPDAHFYVFSDDIEYCKQLFGDNADFSMVHPASAESAYLDIMAMALCENHIIANSSFSWWGAALSDKQGITIMPVRWNNVQKKNVLRLENSVLLDKKGHLIEGSDERS